MMSRCIPEHLVAFFLAAAAGVAPAGTARADSVWTSSGELRNVTVTGLVDGKLQFASNGRASSRDVQQISRLALDGEPMLTAAETAYTAGQFDAATDAYRKTMETTA